MDRYGRLSALAAQIENFKASFADGEKRCKKLFEDVSETFRAFKLDQKVLQQRKDEHVRALKGIKEEVVSAQ